MSDDKDILVDKVRGLDEERDAWPGGLDNTANVLGENRKLSDPLSFKQAKREMHIRSRRNFLIGGAAAIAGVFGWRWMSDETKAKLLRRTLEFNERIAQTFYSPTRLAPEFPVSGISPERVNGMEGLEKNIDLTNWRLSVGGIPGYASDLVLSLDDIKRLPRTEMTTEFKCIEGWSLIVNWAGVRFSDFVAKYAGGKSTSELPQYVSMKTPDEKYFVGWDLPSILHPQTLLAYEMNGAPLTNEHGAPLRLASPTKYGIKQIKRIGRIDFTNERPRDFWAEYDYDWYAGH
jgi:DMSO/TMAO reductase YedYZ molybdopterin-dependent catalytic subunit